MPASDISDEVDASSSGSSEELIDLNAMRQSLKAQAAEALGSDDEIEDNVGEEPLKDDDPEVASNEQQTGHDAPSTPELIAEQDASDKHVEAYNDLDLEEDADKEEPSTDNAQTEKPEDAGEGQSEQISGGGSRVPSEEQQVERQGSVMSMSGKDAQALHRELSGMMEAMMSSVSSQLMSSDISRQPSWISNSANSKEENLDAAGSSATMQESETTSLKDATTTGGASEQSLIECVESSVQSIIRGVVANFKPPPDPVEATVAEVLAGCVEKTQASVVRELDLKDEPDPQPVQAVPISQVPHGSFNHGIEHINRSVLPKHASDDTVFALFNSVWEGQIERVKRFIFQQPVLINAVGVKDFRGESLLHTAAKTKNEALARFLMRQEVKPKVWTNEMGRDPLLEAVIMQDYQMVKSLFDGGVYLANIKDCYSFTALHYAARIPGHVGSDMSHFLLRMMQFDLEALTTADALLACDEWPSAEGETAVHTAARHANEKTIRWLIELGADLSAQNIPDRSTALHLVLRAPMDETRSSKQLLQAARTLVSGGCDVDAQNSDGATGLHLAAERGLDDVLSYLIIQGRADPHIKDNEGLTPYLTAAKYGSHRCLRDLVKLSADACSVVSPDGLTAVHYAAQVNSEDGLIALKTLLNSRLAVNLDAETSSGQTPLDLAKEVGNTDAVNMIEEFQWKRESAILGVGDNSGALQSATKIQSLFRGELSRKKYVRTMADRDKKRYSRYSSPKPMRRKKLEEAQAQIVNTMSIKELTTDKEVENFVHKFDSRDAFSLATTTREELSRDMEKADSDRDMYDLLKEFVSRYADKEVFDKYSKWRQGGSFRKSGTIGYEDLLHMLDDMGFLGTIVSKSEVYSMFYHPGALQGKLKPVEKEVTYGHFVSNMRIIGSKADPFFLKLLLEKAKEEERASPQPQSEAHERSTDETDVTSDVGDNKPIQYLRSTVDPADFLPTISGVNSPKNLRKQQKAKAMNPSGIALQSAYFGEGKAEEKPSSPPGREEDDTRQNPRTLTEALMDFTSVGPEKIRVNSNKGPDTALSWMASKSPTSKGSSLRSKLLKDLKASGRASADLAGELMEEHSAESLGDQVPSVGDVKKAIFVSRNVGTWEAKGCCKSSSDLIPNPGIQIITNMDPWLKPVWIEFSPAVAPLPSLIDGAHDSAYASCFDAGDYMGCFEVVMSSLRHTPRNTQPEVYRRMYAQAVVFCNHYALRCLKAKNSTSAIQLLKKAEVMSAPGDMDFPGQKGLRGWTMDIMAQYYYYKKKSSAALQYMNKAMQFIHCINSTAGRAAWKSHMAIALSANERQPEAVKVLKEALADVVGQESGSINHDFISSGRIPHSQRKMVSSLMFNLSICEVLMNRHQAGLSTAKLALLLPAPEHKSKEDARLLARMQGMYEELAKVVAFKLNRESLSRMRTEQSLGRKSQRSHSSLGSRASARNTLRDLEFDPTPSRPNTTASFYPKSNLPNLRPASPRINTAPSGMSRKLNFDS